MRGIYPASFEPTFMAIGKVLELSDKITAAGIHVYLGSILKKKKPYTLYTLV